MILRLERMDRMNDDLISRKALLDRFRYGDKESESDKAWICAVRRMIKEQPTAFNKGKVLEELKKHADIAIETNEAYGSEVAIGEWSAYKQAEEIVEKGGIE